MNHDVFFAASSGDSRFFLNLSESEKHFLEQVTTGGNTVLHVALQYKQFEAAMEIVKLSPSLVYMINSRRNTPLHVAARIGNGSMVKLLVGLFPEQDVETGARQNPLHMLNREGDNALHVAVRHGNIEVVKELITTYASAKLASQTNYAGESALFLAVDRQDYRLASYILETDTDCSFKGRHGMNVLHALVIHTSTYSNKDKSVFKTLKEIDEYKKKKEKARSRSRRLLVITFVWVVNMLFLIRIPKLLDDPSESQDKTQDNDIMRLRTSGTIPTDLVRKVMENREITIDQRDKSGWTPLHIAAHLGNVDFVALLLTVDKLQAYVRNREGLSAFHIAAKEGNCDVMSTLMESCPDIYELLDYRGRNALHTAAESGCWTTIYFLGDMNVFGGLVDEQDDEGNTPSHLAAFNGDASMAEKLGRGGEIVLNATNKEGFTTMDNVLLTSELHSQGVEELWDKGARLSLRGALLKIGIQNLDPRKKTELAGDGDGKSSGDGNGNDEGMSNSDFLKQVREGNMLVATLIATVTFTAAFTVPGGFNQNGKEDGGLAVLSKMTAFRVFLITNTLAFGLSSTSVFVHFLALTTSEEIAFHKKIERRTAFYTNWSIGAMLVAFIAGTYAVVVPHSLGIAVAVLLSCCFLSSLILPVTIKNYGKYV